MFPIWKGAEKTTYKLPEIKVSSPPTTAANSKRTRSYDMKNKA